MALKGMMIFFFLVVQTLIRNLKPFFKWKYEYLNKISLFLLLAAYSAQRVREQVGHHFVLSH